MSNARSMLAIAAVLPMLLAGCETVSGPVADRAALARVCPSPTPPSRIRAILDYLERAPSDAGLDALAMEWERLDEGARVAKGR